MEGLEDGWEITITLLGGETETRHVFPSQVGHDYDRDGQDDLQEFMQGTDPNDPDTSGNGLLDGENIALSYEGPTAQEWMDRGIAYKELDDGRLEFQGAFDWRVDPTMQDTAGNGIMDGDEVGGFPVWILGQEHIVQTDPLEFDTSGDGMGDGFKRDSGLDPSTRDTDGDGVNDSIDINPWIEFQVRLEVESLTITRDPHGRNEVPLRLNLQLSQAPFESFPETVMVGQSVDGEPFSSETLNPSDSGGNFREGRHNATFALTAITQRNNEASRVDLFSHTTGGSESLIGAIHALTGELFVGRNEVDPWPDTATFTGEHGEITFRLVPVWPEPWQDCIDNGCRHGDGEFPWR